jgi:beta-xylosidase
MPSRPPIPPIPSAPDRDDFDDSALAPQWISVRERPDTHCTTAEQPGRLTLRARGSSLDESDAVFVGRRQQHLSCRVRTLIDTSDGEGGLAVRLDERHHYDIEASPGRVQVIARIGPLRTVVASAPISAGPVVLGIDVLATADVHDPRTGPDTVALGVQAGDGEFTALAELEGRYLSTEVAGGFTGRVIGMYAASGTVRFDYFSMEPQ